MGIKSRKLSVRLERYKLMAWVSGGGVVAYLTLANLSGIHGFKSSIFMAFFISGIVAFGIVIICSLMAYAGEEELLEKKTIKLSHAGKIGQLRRLGLIGIAFFSIGLISFGSDVVVVYLGEDYWLWPFVALTVIIFLIDIIVLRKSGVTYFLFNSACNKFCC